MPRTFGIIFSERVAVVYLESMFRSNRDTAVCFQRRKKILWDQLVQESFAYNSILQRGGIRALTRMRGMRASFWETADAPEVLVEVDEEQITPLDGDVHVGR